MKPKAGLVQCRNELDPDGKTGRGIKAEEEVSSYQYSTLMQEGEWLAMKG